MAAPLRHRVAGFERHRFDLNTITLISILAPCRAGETVR